MKRSVGVICECNPFHGGHEYLLGRARESGAEVVVAVMSGCFVQRGEPAIADPHLRAEALIAGGADLVLELPFPYSASGAEFFAGAGVDILDRLGVNELWFGSECGDIDQLERLSRLVETPAFSEAYERTAAEGRGTAQAYFDTVQALLGKEVACFSNDILGIAYLRAIRRLHSDMSSVTVKREGSAYLEEQLSADGFPSATALRRRWREQGLDAVLPLLPSSVKPIFARAAVPVELAYAERLILGHFRLTPPEQLEQIAELGGGLGARMAQAAQKADSLERFFALSATKKYPNARLRRGVLFALTNITQSDLRTPPAYTRLLATNATGCVFLNASRKGARISVVTRHTDLPNTAAAQKQAEIEARAWALYTLCLPKAASAEGLWQKAPMIKR